MVAAHFVVRCIFVSLSVLYGVVAIIIGFILDKSVNHSLMLSHQSEDHILVQVPLVKFLCRV